MKLNTQNAEFVLSAARLADCPRDSLPQIAFAGRSNVGKSSVINRLLNRKNFARVGSAPGKTTHINYFRIDRKVYFGPAGIWLCQGFQAGTGPVGQAD